MEKTLWKLDQVLIPLLRTLFFSIASSLERRLEPVMPDEKGSQEARKQISVHFESALEGSWAVAGSFHWEALEHITWELLGGCCRHPGRRKTALLVFEIYFGGSPRTYWWIELVEWGKENNQGWDVGFVLNMANKWLGRSGFGGRNGKTYGTSSVPRIVCFLYSSRFYPLTFSRVGIIIIMFATQIRN